MFSRRIPRHAQTNALAGAVEALRASGTPFADLTESNPTRAGIPYPAGLLAPLADPRALRYEPLPFGLGSARAAVAADQHRRGANVDPEQVVLTASTSEAYSWLFKLLCDPGEAVLVPRPSYPLFEHLTQLEGVRAEPYALEYHGRWEIDVSTLAAAPSDARAVVVVSPNNPTGSCLTAAELDRLVALCRDREWALIADEVFADYLFESGTLPRASAASRGVTDIASRAGVLSFTLAGLSKTVGLPQLKLGWMIAGGPRAERDAALRALELIADSFLSVGTPVQVALPELLRTGAPARAAIQARTCHNLDVLRDLARGYPACDVLHTDGGWSAVIRVPSTRTEDQVVLDLLSHERILVHPGYFFDFPREAFLVVSLLPDRDVFSDAVARLLRFC
ncbi:MAG: pyridoxal phosphate-dependent aminotransferase [Acidimicrobiia bacterium]|nr:pyridoxal phosphate-dependent aminotransferase [Acidimicrobiia bacterium]